MAHGVNANLARRWVLQAERGGAAVVSAANKAVPSTFVPVQLPATAAVPVDIRVELRRGPITINVSWPCAAASQCGAWLRELLR